MNATAKPIAKQIANDVRRDFQRIADLQEVFHAKAQRSQRRKALPRFKGFLCAFAIFAPLREKY